MQSVRRSIFIVTFMLLMFGVVMMYSSSAIYAYDRFGDSAFFLNKHLWFLLGGFVVMLYAMSLDLAKLEMASKVLVIVSIALLLLVLVPGVGVTVGGARRWFRFGNVLSFQPSEFAKFALIVYLAGFMARKGYRIKDLTSGYLPCAILVSTVALLVLLQPDLGTALSLFLIGFLVIYISGGSVRHLLSTALAGLPLLCYLVLSVPYRRKRMLIFLNPWRDKEGSGFQIIQSFLALGSGGFFGVGLGQSKQKLFYLPESHTDFIFSIIGEELGLIGSASVVLLFGIFFWQGMRAFFREHRIFNKMLIFGVTNMITFEALVNMCVSAGVLPTKGLPLPFVSYGGTSLVVHMAAVGLMLNAMREG